MTPFKQTVGITTPQDFRSGLDTAIETGMNKFDARIDAAGKRLVDILNAYKSSIRSSRSSSIARSVATTVNLYPNIKEAYSNLKGESVGITGYNTGTASSTVSGSRVGITGYEPGTISGSPIGIRKNP